MAKCRSCGAPIRWATTEASGARIPLDVEPQAAPNIVVAPNVLGEPIARVVTPGAGETTSHFVTCPAAADHRRAIERNVSDDEKAPWYDPA
jgi:hypothetical protein